MSSPFDLDVQVATTAAQPQAISATLITKTPVCTKTTCKCTLQNCTMFC